MWVRKTIEHSKPPVMTHKPALHTTGERGDAEEIESGTMEARQDSLLTKEHL